ncbi:hypothetical protein [Francisella frigiditurris]|uniref:Lipoprotein n=1 Tax=Francisella frigiditurris TaxID=1542390 RepID=A0A1J0KSI2_9GAMM|nr:hypothetical protein [Francisella frigiditurris]APC96650.1 hypothetical protein KX01_199 [Francisella frigiditurris]
MKKLLILIVTITLSSCSTFMTSYKGPIFNGSDYVSTDVGTTYHYKRVTLEDNSEILLEIKIENCNKDKTLCTYSTKIFNANDKLEGKYNMDYIIKNGSVHIVDKIYKQGSLLLPAKLELGKEVNLINQEEYGEVPEKLVITKEIPSITVNNNEYKDCINIIFETITPTESKDLKVVTNQISCKNIGAVNKELAILYRVRLNRDINDNNFTLYQTYLDTLQEITHDK